MSPSNNIIVKDPDILGGTPVFREREYPSRRFSTPSKVAKRSRSSWKDFLAALEQAKEFLSNPLVTDR